MEALAKIECFATKLFPETPFGKQIRYWMNCDESTPFRSFVPCPKEIFSAFITFYTGNPNENPLSFIDDTGYTVIVANRGVGPSSIAAFKTAINYLHNIAGVLTESPALEVNIHERLKVFSKQQQSSVGEESADPAEFSPRMYHACHVADTKSSPLKKARNRWVFLGMFNQFNRPCEVYKFYADMR